MSAGAVAAQSVSSSAGSAKAAACQPGTGAVRAWRTQSARAAAPVVRASAVAAVPGTIVGSAGLVMGSASTAKPKGLAIGASWAPIKATIAASLLPAFQASAPTARAVAIITRAAGTEMLINAKALALTTRLASRPGRASVNARVA